MTKTNVSRETMEEIKSIVKCWRKIKDRILLLRAKGFKVEFVKMGKGGVLQVKKLKKETRVQISYGYGKYNYAFAVIL